MQITPESGQELAMKTGIKWEGEHTLLDPLINVKLGVYFLSRLRSVFRHDFHHMLLAYNYGLNGVLRSISTGEEIESNYPGKILAIYNNHKKSFA